jgi:hypothetical protein
MKKLATLIAALVASLGLYLATFSVVNRPLTVGGVWNTVQQKISYAQSLGHPKLAIWAGSNGRYSHRCQYFTEATGLPCINLSMAVGIGIDFQLLMFEPLLQAGDVLYVPLEYNQYAIERDEMEGGAENIALVQHAHGLLWSMGLARTARAWGYFDLPFLIHGVIESILNSKGFQRREGVDSMTPQGDQRSHTAKLGLPYRQLLQSSRFDPPQIPGQSRALSVLGDFLDRMHARGVRVIGGLPTTPDGVQINEPLIAQLRGFFQQHGQDFLVLPNRSQYPLDCFFDSLYHLNEGCQIEHSNLVGQAISAQAALASGRALK